MLGLLGGTHYRGKKHGISISQPGMRLIGDRWDDSALFFLVHTHPCGQYSHFFLPHLHHQFPFIAVSPSACQHFPQTPIKFPKSNFAQLLHKVIHP